MHPSSLENMQKCYERFVVPAGLAAADHVEVLDVGGANVNGNYRDIFSGPRYRYRTADIAADRVDIVLQDPYCLPLPDESIDIVLSGRMLEHCERFWLAFQEMVRVMHPQGFLFLIAPSAGPIHRYPVDCYRFYPDAYAALARIAGCRLEAVWRDERGPWQDVVGVFRKRPMPDVVASAPAHNDPIATSPGRITDPTAPENRTQGEADYRDLLTRLHAELAPRRYLEIGVRTGRSLALARCPAIGVDPDPALEQPLSAQTQLFEISSDDFFDLHAATVLIEPPDFVFIDGMHLFEFALRDFMHVERFAAAQTLVVIDDVYPSHPLQAARERSTCIWTGDVWKLQQCLRALRPDLFLLPIDTSPTGLLLIAGLDAGNRVLWDQYNPLVRRYRDQIDATPPPRVLNREDVISPRAPAVDALITTLRRLRGAGAPPSETVAALRGACA